MPGASNADDSIFGRGTFLASLAAGCPSPVMTLNGSSFQALLIGPPVALKRSRHCVRGRVMPAICAIVGSDDRDLL